MAKINLNKHNEVLAFIKANPLLSSKEIHEGLKIDVGYATVKRVLQDLISENLIEYEGKGKATKYQLSAAYELLHPVDMEEYFKKEIDEREIKKSFNHSLINDTLSRAIVFTSEELVQLNNLQKKYKANIAKLKKTEFNKELERLVIDLSWKSSQIEGKLP